MRPETAYNKVALAFKRWDGTSNFLEFKTVIPEIKKLIEVNITEIKELNRRWGIEDSHTEFDMYYENSIGNIDSELSQLEYISDRFNCVGRLKFLLTVITNNKET